MVGSDAKAQSDIYAAAMLAGVVGSDCIVLAGPRGQPMPTDQQARLQAANAGGFVVGGLAAVPTTKITGRSMTRLSGPDRWATARRVGQQAAGVTPDAGATQGVPPTINGVAVPPQSQGSCVGEDPIVVGSDPKAQSDIYAAAMLAGVVGSDCIVLAGPRGQPMPTDQQARLQAANAGGFVVGGLAAVPTTKITGRSMTRLSGPDRWATARLVGRRAAGDTTAGTPTDQEPLKAVFDRAANQRAEIVAELTRQMKADNYGIDSNNLLRGPSGFQIYLNECPDNWSNTAGITASEIRIGHSVPLSGNLAAYGAVNTGMQDYFNWVNENDPIAGKQIALISRDDAYSAERTIENVNAFIDTENVFSISTLGTPGTLATYDHVNNECIPHPFVQSGHPAWGDPVIHPWTTGMQFAYNTEAKVWGTWIELNLSQDLPVKVAGLVMDNNFGVAYEAAFDDWATAHPEVVSEFIPVRHNDGEFRMEELADEMQAIADAAPDVFISMTAGTPCLNAIQLANTNGLASSIRSGGGAMFTSSVCRTPNFLAPVGSAADGWLSVGGGAKDSTDPAFADEPFVALLNARFAAAAPDTNSDLFAHGYTIAYAYVEALRIAAELPDGLTRANLMLAVRSLDISHPLLLDGIRFRLDGAADAYPIEGTDISPDDADSGTWGTPIEIIDVDGQTPNCVWTHDGCGSATRDRLTTMYASGAADLNDSLSAWGYAHRADRPGPENRLKPGYWQATADSFCLYWDHATEEWKQGSNLGTGWIQINHVGIEFDQSTRIRIVHGDYVEVATWSGGNFGARRCQLDWVADLD